MSFSTPQVESKIQFSPLPQDIEQGHQEIHDNDRNIAIEIKHCKGEDEEEEEHFDCESFMILLRLAFIGMLLVGLALRQEQSHQPSSDPFPPKFFLESLHVPHFNVSNGELTATWDVNLTVFNVMNSTNMINIQRLDAGIQYKGNETLAVTTPIEPIYLFQSEVFVVEAGERKRIGLKFSMTGWEKDQPIVDYTVIQGIAEDMKLRGVVKFGVQLRVMGEVEFDDGWVQSFTMYPRCTGLEVRFAPPEQQGEMATVIHRKPRECVGVVEWGPLRDSL